MKKLIVCTTLLWSLFTSAQMSLMMGNPGEIEPIGINLGYFPDLGGTKITTYGANLNAARPIGKSVLGLSLGYQYFDFVFDENTNLVDLSTYENMHLLRANISFIRPLENSWGLLLSGGTSLMSNLANSVTSEDFIINAIFGVTKRWGNAERNSQLLLGAFYGTQLGEPTVFPAISFRQKMNEHWSYSLGIPITGINYQINKKHRLSVLASPQGFFGNNSSEVAVDGNRVLTNTKLQFNGINTRLSYRYKFTKNLAFVTDVGFVPAATLKILDDGNEDIFDLDPGSGAYANLGLRFVLNRPQQKRNPKTKNNEN